MCEETQYMFLPISRFQRAGLHLSRKIDSSNKILSKNPPILFIALGNPTPQYDDTRHNVGYWAIDKMAVEAWPDYEPFVNGNQRTSVQLSNSIQEDHRKILLAKTTNTFMNVSGPAVAKAWQKFKQQHTDQDPCLVVLHDELQVPLGKVQIRRKNTSARGHNGLRSIDKSMGNKYTKLAIGIGKAPGPNVADYVLSKFRKEERHILETVTMPLIMKIMDQMVHGEHVHDVLKH